MSRIKLSEHFNYKKLFKFVLPSVIMMVFVSVYGIVDGFFVSNFVGEVQFAALNLIFPLIMILGSVGFMLGTGGNAVVSKVLGEGDNKKANRIFSMLVYSTVIIGAVLAIIGVLVARPVARLFAASETGMNAAQKAELVEYCVMYSRTILAVLPAFMLQNAFQGFFITAEKPRLGLAVTVIAGCGNIVFDALFVVVLKWGLFGAAVATALNQVIGGIIPILYFSRKNDSLLRLGKTNFQPKILAKVCYNGLSELMTNISLSVVAIVYNAQLMKLVGINGVSAYGVMQYIGFIFVAVYLGYSVGSAPIIGYHYGAQNHFELKSIYKKSLNILTVLGVAMSVVAFAFAKPLSAIFVRNDPVLLELTTNGMRIYAWSFLVCGINIFASAFFTALGNGTVSLILSFLRLFLLQIVCVLVLPLILGLNGVWGALIASEVLALFLSFYFLLRMGKVYHYRGKLED